MIKKAAIIFSLFAFIWACQQGDGDGKESISRENEKDYFPVSKYTGSVNADGRMLIGEIQEKFQAFLSAAVEEHGFEGALEFCKTNAHPFTDSLADYYGVLIKRSALRYRNPENEPDTIDRTFLRSMKAMSDRGDEPTPMSMKFMGGDAMYYSPIVMKGLCLNCHGVKSRGDIKPEVQAKINELYPDDEAYDFNVNELRGVWAIYFPPEYFARRGTPPPRDPES